MSHEGAVTLGGGITMEKDSPSSDGSGVKNPAFPFRHNVVICFVSIVESGNSVGGASVFDIDFIPS